MGYFQVRYDYRVVNYDLRDFIRLATGLQTNKFVISNFSTTPTFLVRYYSGLFFIYFLKNERFKISTRFRSNADLNFQLGN